MNPLVLHSEPVAEHGNIVGEGLEKLLGVSPRAQLEVALREAVQNSWDARAPHKRRQLLFGIQGWTLSAQQAKALDSCVLHQRPVSKKWRRVPKRPKAFVFYDRGTTGLGGDVNPRSTATGPRDFSNFVYMIGEKKAGSSMGGTYGYGRSSFFACSRQGTVLVHTACKYKGRRESRFVGMGWLPGYKARGKGLMTGRHWWGQTHESGWIGPVVGPEADELALALGMPIPRRWELGTTIMVLEPDLRDLRGDVAPRLLESAIVWNFWPRIVRGDVLFELSWDGRQIEIRDPREHPQLRLFVRAFKKLATAPSGSAQSPTQSYKLERLRPRQVLGRLGLSKGAYGGASGDDEGDLARRIPAGERAHHVALLRSPMIVVRYRRCAEPEEGLQYGGVFLAEPDLDEVFARAEPPAHDNWVCAKLDDKTEKGFVQSALRQIRECTREFVEPFETDLGPGPQPPLAAVSDHLGGLLPGIDAEGSGPRKRSRKGAGTGGGRRRRKPRVTWSAPRHLQREGSIVLEIPFEVQHVNDEDTAITVKTSVLLDGSVQEKEPPAGAAVPSISRWSVGGSQSECGETVVRFVVSSADKAGLVEIAHPSDCMVQVDFSADRVGESD